ncbi:MAG TPA: phasin family protein [Candidatus Megaira endosymbiont of Stentor roeselii]|nr:phasin family protein [Candidatus Megaera endosymbiont of Stentor roeselii]
MNNNNPFEFFQSFMNQENLAKSMKWMPNMDMSSLENIMKDTAEAITSTNQLISDTVQSIAKRGADSFQKNTSEMFNTMKEAASAGDVEQIANCQQNYWRSTVEHNINSAKEILDIASKSSIEVLEVMGKNFTEKMNKPFAAKTKHN